MGLSENYKQTPLQLEMLLWTSAFPPTSTIPRTKRHQNKTISDLHISNTQMPACAKPTKVDRKTHTAFPALGSGQQWKKKHQVGEREGALRRVRQYLKPKGKRGLYQEKRLMWELRLRSQLEHITNITTNLETESLLGNETSHNRSLTLKLLSKLSCLQCQVLTYPSH